MRAVALLIVLVIGRALGLGPHYGAHGWWAAASLWPDAAVALAFAVFEIAFTRRPRVVSGAYALLAAYAVLNIPVQRALGTPLTLAMWRAAGGPLADSIAHYATWTNGAAVSAGIAAAALAPLAVRRLRLAPSLALLSTILAGGLAASSRVDGGGLERNALTALAGSIAARMCNGRCGTHAEAASAAGDWRASEAAADDADLTPLRGLAAGQNIVLISLESTGAGVLGLYGAQPDAAPNLSALAKSGVVFDNAYAVYPESIKGLLTVLCSAAPPIDTDVDAAARMPCRSLGGALAERGYRTALFHSGRFDYLGMHAVVQDRGYARLADAGNIGGRRDSSFGIDEPSTVASMLQWIDAGRSRPFFLTYLPIAGHHPYEAPDGGPFPDSDEAGRHRNAVHYGDAALGALRRGLEARGLGEQTIWIVFGDHGEAFGQHAGNYGHTFHVYDENVRVPFVIAAPGRIAARTRVRRVVSLLDTAPTVLDLAGAPPVPSYQGSSMLDPQPRAALFFTDYSLPLAGVRDGRWKLIRDLRSRRSRLFDLVEDPGEQRDVGDAHPALLREYGERVEGWIAAGRRQRPW